MVSSVARVYATANEQQDRSYWDYDNMVIQWG